MGAREIRVLEEDQDVSNLLWNMGQDNNCTLQVAPLHQNNQ